MESPLTAVQRGSSCQLVVMRRVMLAMLLQSLLLISLLAAASLADNKNEVAHSTVKDHTEDSILVPTVPIGRGLHIPVLGLGTAALGGRGEVGNLAIHSPVADGRLHRWMLLYIRGIDLIVFTPH